MLELLCYWKKKTTTTTWRVLHCLNCNLDKLSAWRSQMHLLGQRLFARKWLVHVLTLSSRVGEPTDETADTWSVLQLESLPVGKPAAKTQQSVPQTDSLLLTKPTADPVEPAPSTLVTRSGRGFKPPASLVEHCWTFWSFLSCQKNCPECFLFFLQRGRCYDNRHVTRAM